MISSKELSPGSKLRFAILSIGGRFQEQALKLATPFIPDLFSDSVPPRPRNKTPSFIIYSFSAFFPLSSKPYEANSFLTVGSKVIFIISEPYFKFPKSCSLTKLHPA